MRGSRTYGRHALLRPNRRRASRAVGTITATAGAAGATATGAALGGVAVVLAVDRLSVTVALSLLMYAVSVYWLLQSGRRAHTQAAPYVILSGAMTLIGLCGYFLYPAIAGEGPLPHLFFFDRSEAAAQQALLVYAIAAVVPAAFARFSPARRQTRRAPSGPDASVAAPVAEHPSRWLVAVAAITPLVWLAGCDIPSLVERTSYQAFYGSFVQLYRVGNGLSLGATVLALFLLSNRPSAGQRLLLYASLALTVFLTIGTTSRQAALLPLIALAVWLVRGRPPRATATAVTLLALLFSLVLLQAMLTLRNGGPHGWVPYLWRLTDDPAPYLIPDPPRHIANLLSGFAKAGYLLSSVSVDQVYLWSQLDPRPQLGDQGGTEPEDGFIVSYIPFNTLGTLAAVSVPAVIGFSILTCAVFWVSTSLAGATRGAFYRHAALALLCGGALLIAIFYSQYPVRSTVRVLTYLPVLSLSVVVLERVRWRMTSGPASGVPIPAKPARGPAPVRS